MRNYLMIGTLAIFMFVGLTPQASANSDSGVLDAEIDASALTECIGNVATDCNSGVCAANVGVPLSGLYYSCDGGICTGNVLGHCSSTCVANVWQYCDGGICAANVVGSCDAGICAANALTACNEGICVGNVASTCDGPICAGNVLTTCGQNTLLDTILAMLKSTGQEIGTVELSA